MYKVKILSIGKNKETWLSEASEEYIKRLKPIVSIEWGLAKQEAQLQGWLEKETFVALDPKGKSLCSLSFANWLQSALIQGGSRLVFAIGGAEGLSDTIRDKAEDLISLSPLTFTHQLTRLILLEQLYRATEIHKGSPYHK